MRILTKGSALTLGSELWVIPDPQNSSWASQIDFYSNALISRAETHTPKDIAPALAQILKDEGIPHERPAPSSRPLLLATQEGLPNLKTLVLQFTGDTGTWFQEIEKSWKQLGSPSLRVFLPRGVAATKFETFWKKSSVALAPVLALTIVEDRISDQTSGARANG